MKLTTEEISDLDNAIQAVRVKVLIRLKQKSATESEFSTTMYHFQDCCADFGSFEDSDENYKDFLELDLK